MGVAIGTLEAGFRSGLVRIPRVDTFISENALECAECAVHVMVVVQQLPRISPSQPLTD